MKKLLFIFVFSLFLFTACEEEAKFHNGEDVDVINTPSEEDSFINMDKLNSLDIIYEEGTNEKNRNLESAPDLDCVPDKETAVAVATIILENYQKSGYVNDFAPKYIYYDTDDKIWHVSFWRRTSNDPQSGIMISLRQENAEIIGVYID